MLGCPTRRSRSPPTDALRAKRVLIVDDNQTNLRLVRGHTAAWQMTAHDTTSPHEALAWLEAGQTFDVASFDYRMPGMDGMELARRAHALCPTMPLVLLSSFGRPTTSVARLGIAGSDQAGAARRAGQHAIERGHRQVERHAAADADGGTHMAAHFPLRILLAEDNSVNQKVAAKMLARLGYRIDIVGNGAEALDAIKRQPYDVILMDLHMPVLDGLEASQAILRLGSRTERPYIVALTASALEEERRRCFAAGMDDYVSKPVAMERLIAALRRAVDHHGRSAPTPSPGIEPSALGVLERDIGPGAVREVVDSYLRDAPERIAALRAGLAAHDARTVAREAHTLKSSSATVGAMAITEIAAELEAAAAVAISDAMAARVGEIEQLLALAVPALEAERDRRAAAE